MTAEHLGVSCGRARIWMILMGPSQLSIFCDFMASPHHMAAVIFSTRPGLHEWQLSLAERASQYLHSS